jgi:hypothetical protein
VERNTENDVPILSVQVGRGSSERENYNAEDEEGMQTIRRRNSEENTRNYRLRITNTSLANTMKYPDSNRDAMNNFPTTDRTAMDAYYGKHVLGKNGKPTAAWEREYLTQITLPYPMRLAWALKTRTKKLTCHKKVADDMTGIFKDILAHYGSLEAVAKVDMDVLGGCYNFRAVRGHKDRLSTHSWGAAIDIDPDTNYLHRNYDEKLGMMPMPVVRIFESYGWQWGGLWDRGDAMHFQACRS